MTYPNEDFKTLGNILSDINRLSRHMLRNWPVFLVASLAGGLAGWGIYFLQKPKYEAECTFILEEKQSSMGGLSGLASQFGVDIGGMGGGGGMFSGDNILAILTSKSIVEDVLLSKTDSGANQKKLIDSYLEFSGLKKKWSDLPLLQNVQFAGVKRPSEMTVIQDSVMNIVYAQVLENHLSADRVSKKGTIIQVQTVSQNPEFSRLMVRRVVDASRDYYINVKTSLTASNIARLQRKADSLLTLLTNKTYQAAQVQGIDLNPGLRTLTVPTEIASRDKTVLATLYSEVVKNLEIARTTLMLQTPVIEVLDAPSLSLYDNKKRKLFFITTGVFVAILLTSIVVFIRYQLKR